MIDQIYLNTSGFGEIQSRSGKYSPGSQVLDIVSLFFLWIDEEMSRT